MEGLLSATIQAHAGIKDYERLGGDGYGANWLDSDALDVGRPPSGTFRAGRDAAWQTSELHWFH